jgi:hypothetical protein
MDELATSLSGLVIGNIGEQDEYSFKKELFGKRMDISYCISLFGEKAQKGIELVASTGQPYQDLYEIPKKAKSSSKCDLSILFKNTQEILHLSIKSKRGSNPSILNHTPRSANVFQHGPLKDDLIYLDMLAKEYHDKRTKGTISEDVKLSTLENYSIDHIKQSVFNLLIYFIFIGTGRQASTPSCNSIMILNKDTTKTFISCITQEEKETYVTSLIDHCILSFRHKGMRKRISEQDMPWVGHYKNKNYGSIHIRLSLK